MSTTMSPLAFASGAAAGPCDSAPRQSLWSRFCEAYTRWQVRRAEPYVRRQLMQLRPDRLVELGYAPTEIADLMLAHRVPDHRIM